MSSSGRNIMQIGVIAWFVMLNDGLWTQSRGRERSLVGCLVISFNGFGRVRIGILRYDVYPYEHFVFGEDLEHFGLMH